MRIKKTILGLFIALLPALSFSAEEVRIDETRSIFVTIKEGWTMTPMANPRGLPARTIHIATSGSKISLTMVASSDGMPIKKTAQQLSAMEKDTSMQYVPNSVEGEIVLKHFSNENMFGSYASFTDKKWQGKKPTAGEYSCITSGAFLVDGILVAVTFLSSDLDGQTYKDGLSIIESLASKY
jgi:hypothetical protein